MVLESPSQGLADCHRKSNCGLSDRTLSGPSLTCNEELTALHVGLTMVRHSAGQKDLSYVKQKFLSLSFFPVANFVSGIFLLASWFLWSQHCPLSVPKHLHHHDLWAFCPVHNSIRECLPVVFILECSTPKSCNRKTTLSPAHVFLSSVI